MFQQWYDVVYNIFEMGQELEKYNEKHFHLPQGRFLEHQGLTTHYLEEGEGRHTLIFLHGIMMNSNIWDAYLHRFSNCAQVYALDFLGHGLSTKKPDVSLEDLLCQLDTFIETKKLKNPVLIGHSLGGMIGAIYAARHPEKVKGLIAISSVDYDSFVFDFKTLINSSVVRFLEGLLNPLTSLMFMETLMKQVYNKESFIKTHERDHFLYHIKIKGFKDSAFSLMKNYRLQNFSSAEYSKIQCPTLLIHGDRDKLIHVKNSETLAKTIPHAKLEKISGGSHMLIHEDQEKVMRLMEEALSLSSHACLRK